MQQRHVQRDAAARRCAHQDRRFAVRQRVQHRQQVRDLGMVFGIGAGQSIAAPVVGDGPAMRGVAGRDGMPHAPVAHAGVQEHDGVPWPETLAASRARPDVIH